MSNRVPRLPARIARAASAMAKPLAARTSPMPSKIGPAPSTNRNIATAPVPSAQQGQAETRTTLQTYFTKVQEETQILYNGDRQWARITLTLETAGPVAVGTSQKITPVLSGKGILLITGEPETFVVPKNTRLYIASTAVNRVKLQIEASPWLEQITGLLGQFVSRFTGGR